MKPALQPAPPVTAASLPAADCKHSFTHHKNSSPLLAKSPAACPPSNLLECSPSPTPDLMSRSVATLCPNPPLAQQDTACCPPLLGQSSWAQHGSQQSSPTNQTARSVPGLLLQREVAHTKASQPAAKALSKLRPQAERFSLEQLMKSGNRLPSAPGHSRPLQARAGLARQPALAEQHVEHEVAEQYAEAAASQGHEH